MTRSLRRHVAIGAAVTAALAVGISAGAPDASARNRKKGRRSAKNISVQSVNVARASGIAANEVIEIRFSGDVDPRSINAAQVRIRGENDARTGFTKGAFGTFQVVGNVVRFFPRLPGHLRDPDDVRGGFYPVGSARDDAASNAGFQPATTYEIRISGKDDLAPVRALGGRPLRRTFVTRFTTAPALSPSDLYTTSTYLDSPPPRIAFTNPPDSPADVVSQYARAGGTLDVPNDLTVSLFATKVPLAPQTLRTSGNVSFDMLARNGDRSLARPVEASAFVEQSSATTRVALEPRFPLADRGLYAVRLTKRVRDLTESFDLQSNPQRERLRALYDWLSAARRAAPGVAIEELPDPPAALTIDWPTAQDRAARGILKANLLALGDSSPEEIDPRVFALFSTRDEPVSDAVFDVNFLRAEDLVDARLSSAEVDRSVPGAASAILTIAGGSGRDGDFSPDVSTTLSSDQFPGGVANFRDVVIPPGVTVKVSGSRPLVLRALSFALDGVLAADGTNGTAARSGSYDSAFPPDPQNAGGAGGPGGGAGASSGTYYYHPSRTASGTTSSGSSYTVGADATAGRGATGRPGVDLSGSVADAEDGGRGGLGGTQGTGTSYNFGAAGGGGGARLPGGRGANTTSAQASWNGVGGSGGAGSSNDALDPLVGGGGGGSGANSTWGNGDWSKTGAGAGGGGGAVQIQTARTLAIGTLGALRAEGGRGGAGTGASGTLNAGPGGGGGGGSILLRTTAGFDLTDPASGLSVRGGAGGTHSGASVAPNGGAGGAGYVRLEDPAGGLAVPGATGGIYDPVGGGVPSVVYTKFADLGVPDPRIVPFALADVVTQPTANDAIVVEMQMTREHPSFFGTPDLDALDDGEDSLDQGVTSRWVPVKVHDNTGVPGGAIQVSGWNPAVNGTETVFPIDELNGHGYRFVRYRVRFQLDETHSRLDPIPFVDRIRLHFQFNF